MHLYDIHAHKKATNLTINSDLLAKAKSLHINLSKTLEDGLIQLLQEKENQLWLEQNKLGIEEYNKRINEEGSFGDKGRVF